MNKLWKFVLLPQDQQWLYLTIAIYLIAIKLGLLLFGFNKLYSLAKKKPHKTPLRHLDQQEMHTVVLAINRLGKFLTPLKINCLPQAIVGNLILSKKGFQVTLKIGVYKNIDNILIAHAWLEHNGEVILGQLNNLREFLSFPSLQAH